MWSFLSNANIVDYRPYLIGSYSQNGPYSHTAICIDVWRIFVDQHHCACSPIKPCRRSS
ncbi:hypothetical protein QWZ13_11150 [Reinekea marina]|uniref:hypothetical protein n=1 Tax=Reinekea marina TaxID=1310421 RepID=UPI0025B58453|nr:hypothetical protein [Reinekea marina]MDN3649470.1 hypothetical protein [Reinekea marina]